MKRPSFQFYPGDWQANSNLRRCNHAEKGVWVDVMCLLHDQEEYGVLRWTLKEIAQAVGCTSGLLRGVVTKGVLKGSDTHLDEAFVYTPRSGRRDGEPVTLVGIQAGPIWYSSRMVKDEYVRTIRGESTRFGAGNGDAPKDAPKPPFGDGSTSPSSSSASPIHSEPNGSGASPPPADLPAPVLPKPEPAVKPAKPKLTDPADIIFGYGLSMLTNAGTKDSTARSFLGGLRKIHGDAALIDKLRICAQERVLQPLEWLAAALPPPNVAGKPNAQEALEAANAAVLSKFLAEDAHAAH